ncbi:hypothetical protein MRX96_030289 [Rhipicephalus microplus]
MHRQRPPRPKRRGAETAVPPSPQLPTPVVTPLNTPTASLTRLPVGGLTQSPGLVSRSVQGPQSRTVTRLQLDTPKERLKRSAA